MVKSMAPGARRSKSARPARTPYLMTSAQPSRKISWGRVFKSAVSQSTAVGWWKAPQRFFPAGRSMAVLPPTELSTMAKRVVGT